MTKTETAKNLLKRVFVKGEDFEYYEIDGKFDGEYKSWYKNGELYKHSYYKNDKPDGEGKMWHENGQLEIHYYFKNGELDGEYERWDEDGELLKHYYYEDGVIVKII